VWQFFRAACRRGIAYIAAGFAGGGISDGNTKLSRRAGTDDCGRNLVPPGKIAAPESGLLAT